MFDHGQNVVNHGHNMFDHVCYYSYLMLDGAGVGETRVMQGILDEGGGGLNAAPKI